jgi:hypothetical protein
VLVSPEPRTLVGVARFGFSKEVYDFMKMHPDHEFSPEEVAKRLNRPEKRGLASTALSRLFHQGDVERTQIGRYIYRSSRPLNFSKEAQSNGAPR